MTFTPLGIASLCVSGVVAPLTVWAVQSTFKTLKRANSLAIKFAEAKKDSETKLCDVRRDMDTADVGLRKDLDALKSDYRKDIDALSAGSQRSDGRIQRVEDAIVDIRAAVQRSDEQFTAIMLELKSLPRLTATLEALDRAIAGFVPRPEIDSRIKHVEERLNMFELQRVRGAS